MAVKIRLKRMGGKGKPFYRVVVADSRSPRDGRVIATLGYYDPRTEPATVKIDEEKALIWLGNGAQPTDTAGALLKKQGIVAKFQASKGTAVEAAPAEVEEKKAAPRKKKAPATEAPAAESAVEETAVVAEAAVEEQPTEAQE